LSSTNNNHQLSKSTTTTTEAIIEKQIEGIKKMISLHDVGPKREEKEATGGIIIQINPAMKRHFELEIKTLREAPRDPDKLRRLLKAKQIEWEEARHIEDIQRLVTEIEMLKFVLCVVLNYNNNNKQKKEAASFLFLF
jgi:hypothetical protein